eukprot:417428_1
MSSQIKMEWRIHYDTIDEERQIELQLKQFGGAVSIDKHKDNDIDGKQIKSIKYNQKADNNKHNDKEEDKNKQIIVNVHNHIPNQQESNIRQPMYFPPMTNFYGQNMCLPNMYMQNMYMNQNMMRNMNQNMYLNQNMHQNMNQNMFQNMNQ